MYHEISTTDWIHTVLSYDESAHTLKWYVNGNEVGEIKDTGTLKFPNFTDNFFTIGSAMVQTGYGEQGLKGAIATCNLYKNPVTEDEAKALYTEQELDNLLTTKHTLRADENGEFKVLVLSDVQFNTPTLNEETLNNIETIVKRENPDLVIFNGDNCFNIRSVEDMTTYVTNMTKYLEDNKIPWAHVYGNHDAENNEYWTGTGTPLTREEQQAVFESFAYCVSKSGDADVFGVGNFVLPVFAHDSDEILYNVWCMDSGTARGVYADFESEHVTVDSNTFFAHYEPMQDNQITWYETSSKLLQEYNGGKSIPAMMAFHIPLQASYYAWTNRTAEGADLTGEKRENISAHATEPTVNDVDLFGKIKELGDVKVVVNSHDHLNDFAVTYQGVRFAYTACIGTLEYHADELLGGRVVKFSPAEDTGMTTYMSYVQERPNDTADILDLVIGNDNTVTNGISGRPALTSHDRSGGTKSIKTDATLNQKVLSFTGGTNYPSTYNLPVTYMQPLFSDGFSYEIMFKVNDGNFQTTKGYVGILDMEENGGWGLNLYKNTNDPSKPTLKAEVAYADTWNSLTYTVDVGKWYHCVYSYDGTNVALYINGVCVKSATVTGAYRPTSFSSSGSDPYICIGACAQAITEGVEPTEKSMGMNGFVGDIAKIKIMTSPVNATQAKALAQAQGMDDSTAPILDLVIGEDGSVTNGSATRNPLTSHDYEGSTKEVVTSQELAR
ncbi:MAG: metallophosphoesterase, partial [Clostridia bacterium]|nr:metallophosphoesterase [Clostridia bacterium]